MNQSDEQNNNALESEQTTGEPVNPTEITPDAESETSAVEQVVNDIEPVSSDEENILPASAETPGEAAEVIPTAFAEEAVQPVPSETGNYKLVNAMVGKSYQAELNLKELKIDESFIRQSFAEQLATLGLSAKRDGGILRIEGTPLADSQGEHTLFLDYTYDEQRLHRKKITLLINPDPKSLWKNLEPDSELPFRKEHTASIQISSRDFHIIAASRRGRSHAHEGKFREDDFAVNIDASGWHILIVADGAGSAKLSREGSRLACQTALEFLKKSIAELLEPKAAPLITEFIDSNSEASEKELKNLLYQVLCGAAFASYKRLEQESGVTGNPIKDYSTTLLISIAKKIGDQTFVASFGIGDGAIGVYNEHEHTVDLMISPDGGEFSGQTRFLTMREVVGDGSEMLRRIKFKVFRQFTFLALMTDGISDPKFGTDNNLISPEKWRELGTELVAEIDIESGSSNLAQQLLEYMDFWSPGEHDDRTLAILI